MIHPKHLISVFGFSLLIQVAGVGTGLLSSRLLGPQGKGELTTVILWASVLLYAGNLGLSEATAYFVGQKLEPRSRVFATSQWLVLGLGVGITLIGWALIPVVLARQDAWLVSLSRQFLLFYVIPGLSSLCLVALLQGGSQWLWFNLSRTTPHLVTLSAMVVMWLMGHISVVTFAIASLVGNGATVLVALLGTSLSGWFSWRGSRPLAKAMLAYGFKVQIGAWASMANVRFDQLLMSILLPSASLGLYVVAVTYAAVVNLVPATMAQVSLPILITAHNSGSGAQVLERFFRWSLWLTALPIALLMLNSAWLLPWLFGRQFSAAVPMTYILLLAALPLSSNLILSTGFKAFGQPLIASQAEALGLFLTVILLLILLPSWGGIGAAFASLGSYFTSTLFLGWFAYRIFGVRPTNLIIPQIQDWEYTRLLFLKLMDKLKTPA